MIVTIDRILHAAFPHVRDLLNPLVDWKKAEPAVEAEYFYVPLCWTSSDERKNPLENQRIALVKALIENGISSLWDAMSAAGVVPVTVPELEPTVSIEGDMFMARLYLLVRKKV